MSEFLREFLRERVPLPGAVLGWKNSSKKGRCPCASREGIIDHRRRRRRRRHRRRRFIIAAGSSCGGGARTSSHVWFAPAREGSLVAAARPRASPTLRGSASSTLHSFRRRSSISRRVSRVAVAWHTSGVHAVREEGSRSRKIRASARRISLRENGDRVVLNAPLALS